MTPSSIRVGHEPDLAPDRPIEFDAARPSSPAAGLSKPTPPAPRPRRRPQRSAQAATPASTPTPATQPPPTPPPPATVPPGHLLLGPEEVTAVKHLMATHPQTKDW